jgi:hypothetical protein
MQGRSSPESNKEQPVVTNGREFDEPAVYQIRVKGNVDCTWSNWFHGFTIAPQANDQALLTGPVADQAALYGLLSRIRDLGLPLLSIERVQTSVTCSNPRLGDGSASRKGDKK